MLRLGWKPPKGVLSPASQEATELAERTDLAIVVVRTYESEEFDRPELDLPNGQADLIRAVASANPNMVVVLMNAGPVEIVSWEQAVPAILEAWYAGQEQGAAVARVLFGDVNPAGKLPITFPRSLKQTPVSTPAQYPGIEDKVHYSEGLFVGYRGYDKFEIEPQYQFGYGLSYTNFEYANLSLGSAVTDDIKKIQVSFDISNTGDRAGVDIAQIYLGLPESVSAPLKRLAGWARVSLKPGEKQLVSVILDPDSAERPLSYWNVDTQAWEISEGEYQIFLGASSRDIRLTATFKILKPLREQNAG
jgi:beta-glucosidase